MKNKLKNIKKWFLIIKLKERKNLIDTHLIDKFKGNKKTDTHFIFFNVTTEDRNPKFFICLGFYFLYILC